MTKKENFLKGFIKENPIFVFLLGMCPALAVTATIETSLGMGLLVIFVLTSSNIVISLLRNFIPHDVRTPSYIVVIATFVTIVRMATEFAAPELYEALGVFIPLIVVNCLILGRAEAFASKNSVVDSAIDGLGMGLGFTFALMVIGGMREILATGGLMYGNYLPFFVNQPITLFSVDWILMLFDPNFVQIRPTEIIDGTRYYLSIFRISEWTTSYSIQDFSLAMFSLPPGAFIALAAILAFIQGKKVRRTEREIAERKNELKRLALEKKKAAALQKAGENS